MIPNRRGSWGGERKLREGNDFHLGRNFNSFLICKLALTPQKLLHFPPRLLLLCSSWAASLQGTGVSLELSELASAASLQYVSGESQIGRVHRAGRDPRRSLQRGSAVSGLQVLASWRTNSPSRAGLAPGFSGGWSLPSENQRLESLNPLYSPSSRRFFVPSLSVKH